MKLPKLKECRALRHLTQDELSAWSGVTTRTISKIENGTNVHNATARALSVALNVTLEDLTK